jgi:hypothetical protein
VASLLALLLLLGSPSTQEPVFRIRIQMDGKTGDASFTSNLEIGYAPCAIWTGGAGGGKGSPAQFLEEAGGLGAMRPGMSLPLYGKTHGGDTPGQHRHRGDRWRRPGPMDRAHPER